MKLVGINCFDTEPGKCTFMACKACGAIMDVERNIPASRGFAAAMAGHTKPRDTFSCPHSNKDWHDKLVHLVMEQRQTYSKRIKAILQQDIDDILEENNEQLLVTSTTT